MILKVFRRKLLVFLVGVVVIFLFNEFLIYYFIIGQCSWPNLQNTDTARTSSSNEQLRALILADTHLLGPRRGHWFDKLRREWQMHRAFQTAIWLFQPDVVFMLGDIFDEGLWVNPQEFQDYVNRFHSLFYVPDSTKMVIIVGNHDIGFHYSITPILNQRFEKAFNASSVQLFRFKTIPFVLINSMAMEGDGCFLCDAAIRKLKKIADELDCDRNPLDKKCRDATSERMRKYVQPILLQHFPLFRASDKLCTGDDAAPDYEKDGRFRENWDCLSESSSRLLLNLLQPRLVMSGHTHHGCLYNHSQTQHKLKQAESTLVIPEYSVASFSWRNRDNPSFYLGIFTTETYSLSKCQMPKESTVKWIYGIGVGGLCIYLFFSRLIFVLFRFIASRMVAETNR